MNFIVKSVKDGLWNVQKTQTINGKRILKNVYTFNEEVKAVEFAKKELSKHRYGIIGIYTKGVKVPRVICNKPRIKKNYRTIKEVDYGSSIDPTLLKNAIIGVMIAS